MSSVYNATEYSYVREQPICYFYGALSGRSAPVEWLRAALFSLPGLDNKILNSYTLAAVQNHVLRVFLYLRQIQDTDKVIVDHDALCPVLSPALGLIHIDALYKLMQDGGCQHFHLHELPHRFQKLLLTKGAVVLLVTLALQFFNVLFELLLSPVIPLGHLHKAFIRQLARYIVLC